MKRMIICIVSLWSSMQHNADSEDRPSRNLDAILRGFDRREAEDDASTDAHRAWLKTETGREEALYLAEHYEKLSGDRRYAMGIELARTGVVEIVPFVTKALADSQNGLRVLSGVFFACHMIKPEKAYSCGIAPSVARWIGKDGSSDQDKAIALLPRLDAELAGKVLLTESYLSPNSSSAVYVVEAFNGAGIKVPLEFISVLLRAWESPAANPKSEYGVLRGYEQSIIALALHDPNKAVAVAERLIAKRPDCSDSVSKVYLAANGLTGLYNAICDLADKPDFARLPKPAKIYFAVTYFESDCSNGGILQALGNSTGDYWPLVREGYEAMGYAQGIRFLDNVCKLFGPTGPSTNRKERNRQIDAMKPPFWEQEDAVMAAWDADTKDKPWVYVDLLLNRYAAAHAAVLKPLVNSRQKFEP